MAFLVPIAAQSNTLFKTQKNPVLLGKVCGLSIKFAWTWKVKELFRMTDVTQYIHALFPGLRLARSAQDVWRVARYQPRMKDQVAVVEEYSS